MHAMRPDRSRTEREAPSARRGSTSRGTGREEACRRHANEPQSPPQGQIGVGEIGVRRRLFYDAAPRMPTGNPSRSRAIGRWYGSTRRMRFAPASTHRSVLMWMRAAFRPRQCVIRAMLLTAVARACYREAERLGLLRRGTFMVPRLFNLLGTGIATLAGAERRRPVRTGVGRLPEAVSLSASELFAITSAGANVRPAALTKADLCERNHE